MANRYDEQLGARVLADAPSPAPRLPEKYAPPREPAQVSGIEERAERPLRERPSPRLPEAPRGDEPRPASGVPPVLAAPASGPDAVGLIAFLLAAAAGYLYWDYGATFKSTDDAFIAARQFAIASKVPGYVTPAVPVTDNQRCSVKAMIAQIDQRDYRNALAQAEGQVAAAQKPASKASTRDYYARRAGLPASQAQVAQAQANLELSKVTWGRDKPLVNQGWATAQQGATNVQNRQGPAGHCRTAREQTLEVGFPTANRCAEGATRTADATLGASAGPARSGALNLPTRPVIADQPGRVVNLTGGVGPYRPGRHESDHVRARRDLGRCKLQGNPARPHAAGQPVDIEIDAYPERDFRGHVASVQPGSARPSRCCRPKTPPATTSKSSSACRSRSSWTIRRPTSPSAPACRSSRPCASIPSPSLYERLNARVEQWWRRV